jgi:hypothetical protein
MVNATELFESPDLTTFRILFVSLKSEVYRRKVDTRDELLARILDAADLIKKREHQLRRTTRDLRT